MKEVLKALAEEREIVLQSLVKAEEWYAKTQAAGAHDLMNDAVETLMALRDQLGRLGVLEASCIELAAKYPVPAPAPVAGPVTPKPAPEPPETLQE